MKKANPATNIRRIPGFSDRAVRIAAFAAILAFHFLLDAYWLINDKTPYSWDDANHLLNALHMLRSIQDGHIVSAFTSTGFYPPLYYLTSLPLLMITSVHPVPILINFLFTFLLAFSVYKITARYFGTIERLVATMLVLSYPGIILWRRMYLLDLPQTALVAFSVFCLLNTEGFSKKRESIIAGLVFSLAILLKEYSLPFILPVFLGILIQHANALHRRLVNMLLFGTASLTSLIWYLPNFGNIIEGFRSLDIYAKAEGDPTGITFAAFSYYPQFFSFLFAPILFSFSAIGIVCSFLPTLKKIRILTLSALFSWIVFVLIPNKDPRYVLSLSVFLAVIAAGVLQLFRKHARVRYAAALFFIGAAFAQSLVKTDGRMLPPHLFAGTESPQKKSWPLLDVVRFLGTREADNPVVLLTDDPFVNVTTFNLIAQADNIPAAFTSSSVADSEQDLLAKIADAPAIVLKTHPELLEYRTTNFRKVLKSYALFDTLKEGFKSVAEFPMPDGTRLIVYRQNK